jgi:hypothetical protein
MSNKRRAKWTPMPMTREGYQGANDEKNTHDELVVQKVQLSKSGTMYVPTQVESPLVVNYAKHELLPDQMSRVKDIINGLGRSGKFGGEESGCTFEIIRVEKKLGHTVIVGYQWIPIQRGDAYSGRKFKIVCSGNK